MENIKVVVKNGLCLSCGICKSICPFDCIKFNNMNMPIVDKSKCVYCGKCKKYCPGLSSNNNIGRDVKERVEGTERKSYVGRCKDHTLLKNAVSGGIATCLINELLTNKKYDMAIGVRNTYFSAACEMELYDIYSTDKEYQKSVYTMPSYSNVINFIKENRKLKIIIIATGCIVGAIKKIIEDIGNDKSNYLFIGLFCDCTLNKNIELYFKNYEGYFKHTMTGINYRDKEDYKGWPGDIKLKFRNKQIFVSNKERYNVVKYFKNKRCLFCLDHMNTNADISLGDNYTKEYADKLGSNSVVIRTEKGQEAFREIQKKVIVYQIPYEKILKSQGVEKKEKNFFYSKILHKEKGIQINSHLQENKDYNKKVLNEYKSELIKTASGRLYSKIPYVFDLLWILRGESSINTRFRMNKMVKRWRKE